LSGAPDRVELFLTLDEAEALHAALEDLLESSGASDERLGRVYRLLGWRILAAKGGTGLTGRIAELARAAESLEEYETARERALGPVLDGLERGENRDP
jgi:chromosome segregation ATPase